MTHGEILTRALRYDRIISAFLDEYLHLPNTERPKVRLGANGLSLCQLPLLGAATSSRTPRRLFLESARVTREAGAL